MQKKYAEKGVVLLALSNEADSKVKPFVKKNRMNYIVASAAKAARSYGVRGYPTYFVIDPDGEVAHVSHSHKQAELSVKKLLESKPPKVTGSLGQVAAKSAYKKARKLHKKKKYSKALKAYEKIVRKHKGTPYADKASARIDKIKSNPEIMAKIRKADAKKKCETWLNTAQTLAGMGKKNEAAEYYQRVIDEFPESKYAETAKVELANL